MQTNDPKTTEKSTDAKATEKFDKILRAIEIALMLLELRDRLAPLYDSLRALF
jgi:hypothetical protein